jgi:type IV pilus assembly protein PilC
VGTADPKAIESLPVSMATPLRIEAEAERLLGRLMIFSWAVFVPAIVALIVTFILPTFRQMFEEFGMQIPASTRLLLDFSSFVNRYGLGYVIAAGTLALGGIAMLLVLIWLFPSWLQHPLLRWFGQSYYRNAGFTVLATLLSQRKDVLAACRETVAILPVKYVANEFAAASKLMEQGAASSTAFRRTRLLSKRECQACGLDLPSVDHGWALQELAAWKVERMLSRYSLIVQATVVILTAILAVVIGLVAVALIGALATMIESLA